MRTALLVSLGAALVVAFPGHAQVYRSVDRHGNVTYSDQPGPNSERVYVPPVQTYTPQPLPAAGKDAAKAEGDPEGSATPSFEVAIVSPVHDAAFRQNDGNVPVTVEVNPGLGEKYQLRLYLDGKPVAEPGTATSFLLPLVDRGSHMLIAEVLDNAGNVLKRSGSVVFHLQRVSIGGG